MAKVTITFEDGETGTINGSIAFDPDVSLNTTPTLAQAVGMALFRDFVEGGRKENAESSEDSGGLDSVEGG